MLWTAPIGVVVSYSRIVGALVVHSRVGHFQGWLLVLYGSGACIDSQWQVCPRFCLPSRTLFAWQTQLGFVSV